MKTISIILIVSLLFSCVACSNLKILIRDDEMRELLQKKKEIAITTHDEQEYEFYLPSSYTFEKDTVYGRLKKGVWMDRLSENVKIPFSDIKKIEQNEFNLATTILLLGSIGLLAYLLQKTAAKPSISLRM